MTYQEQIRKLRDEAIACGSDEEAVKIIRKMRELMHARIEQARANLTTALPSPKDVDKKTA